MINVELSKLFFDHKGIHRSVADQSVKVLVRFAAYVRMAARSSIRVSRRSADPGSPPKSHNGVLRNNIYFVYEPQTRSVVVGPYQMDRPHPGGDGQPVGGNAVPGVLEKGGRISIVETLRAGKWQRVRRTGANKSLPTRVVQKTVEPRPFMTPALERSLSKLPSCYRQNVLVP